MELMGRDELLTSVLWSSGIIKTPVVSAAHSTRYLFDDVVRDLEKHR